MVSAPDIEPPSTVQLLHELPDGSRHVDWMIDLDPVGEGRLVTFHVEQRVDQLQPGERMEADRIADHRRTYLTYEGPVSGDRGEVTRLATGTIEAFQSVGDVWAMLIRWTILASGDRRMRWQRVCLSRSSDGRWTVRGLACG